ncbi:MAG: FeoB-associated Cys-rich membrane protein [Lachnospiraceae bacterium]|nr:FeoB-associated Cys-rich membrane protein [Lachnospiraceae bacterium]
MVDIIISLIIILIVGFIIRYLYKAKKRGETCIGCPYAKQCSTKGNCSSKHTINK